uniref:Uncharacterized protein n=1 Tax=Rhizophora mucronata TaxID=61149 RepID=A0A2P2IJY8_RHIMU
MGSLTLGKNCKSLKYPGISLSIYLFIFT